MGNRRDYTGTEFVDFSLFRDESLQILINQPWGVLPIPRALTSKFSRQIFEKLLLKNVVTSSTTFSFPPAQLPTRDHALQ